MELEKLNDSHISLLAVDRPRATTEQQLGSTRRNTWNTWNTEHQTSLDFVYRISLARRNWRENPREGNPIGLHNASNRIKSERRHKSKFRFWFLNCERLSSVPHTEWRKYFEKCENWCHYNWSQNNLTSMSNTTAYIHTVLCTLHIFALVVTYRHWGAENCELGTEIFVRNVGWW